MQKELREAFRLYDKQGNGYIPTSCLKEILKELDDQLTEQELDIMIEEIDSDGSGTVDFDGKCADQLAAVSRAIKILDSLARCHGIFPQILRGISLFLKQNPSIFSAFYNCSDWCTSLKRNKFVL